MSNVGKTFVNLLLDQQKCDIFYLSEAIQQSKSE